jgi:hypothetical protein
MKEDNLFRFEVFATSKQLGDALAALSGRVAQVTPPQLVANAKANGHGGLSNMSGEKLVELFGVWLHKHKLREFTTSDTQNFLTSIGRSPKSASYVQTRAREYGLIKNISDNQTTSRWQIIGAKRKPARKSTKAKKVAS